AGWADTTPCTPRDASKAGTRSGAARVDISSRISQARSVSLASGCSRASVATRARHRAGSCFQTSVTIVGLAVAPTAPNEIAYSSSSIAHESFQMSVSVVAIVRPSGVSASGGAAIPVTVTSGPPSGGNPLDSHRDGPSAAEAQGGETITALSAGEL